MDDAADNSSQSGERPLIDAAWAQFEALAGRHPPSSADSRRSFAVPGYRILREIHRGGQGVVFQALQVSTQRKVAIKILKEGPLADDAELVRFDREVDVLSRLRHPHIVAIHDRGLAAGHAYFVMDYIPGRTLDGFVTGEGLSTRETLDIYRKVCDAVNFAHLRGVIHRDLKPTNIRIDEDGEPRVLDFGLAKFARETSSSANAMTMTGQFIGSLPWASPEQAEGRSDQLDIRTDVYSLGVMLYHLLAGCFPYPVSGRMDDVVRNILHTSPARPSAIVRGLDRDVEVILLKALAKDPERRYQSAGELARDIQRYLNGEAIEARPATTFCQLRHFARRHKVLVASLSAIMITLAAATAATTWAMLRAREATAQAVAINDFMREVLSSPIPGKQGAEVRLVDVLACASTSAGQRFAGRPLQEAQVHDLLGALYTQLSFFSEAKAEFGKAQALWQEHAGPDDPRALMDASNHALQAINAGRPAEAEHLLAGLVPAMTRVLGPDDPRTLSTRTIAALADLNRGRIEEAERVLLELRVHPRLADEDIVQLQILGGLIKAARWRTHSAELSERPAILSQAEPLVRERMERSTRQYGPDSAAAIQARMMLAQITLAQGHVETAAEMARGVLDGSRESLGECHDARTMAMAILATALTQSGEANEPADLQLRTVECARQLAPSDSPLMLSALSDALRYLDRAGRAVEGETLARELTAALEGLGGGHGDMLFASELYVARFVSMQGRLDEAEPIFQSLIAREGTSDRFSRARLHLFYGGQLARRELYEEAEHELSNAVELIGDVRLGTLTSHPDDIILEFIALYDAWGKPDRAEEYRRLRTEVTSALAQTEYSGN
jgi:tetratricopeptide (TPR) repeat protein